MFVFRLFVCLVLFFVVVTKWTAENFAIGLLLKPQDTKKVFVFFF